jgi:hypothetical protein
MKTIPILFASLLVFGAFAPVPQAETKQKSSSEIPVTAGRVMSRAQLTAFKQVNAGFGQDFAFDGLKIKVKSYTCVITRKKGQSYFESVNGSLITGSLKEQFKTVKSGDMVIITNIEAVCEGNKIFVDPLIATIQ